MTVPEPRVSPVTYVVCGLPEDHPDADAFEVRVEYRGDGLWVVRRLGRFLGRDGTWSYCYVWRDGAQEPTTDAELAEYSSGEDAWRAEHRFDLDTALRMAKDVAPLVKCNGYTVADVLKEWQP
ncbi:hypothetical protein [Prauserella endophytica]|uniref:hypothetical protein n=1 Tax=Prauserella endophytica TaxID=1592324 RepID=UPI000D96800B|nr:hypothetical protein [Prauserella endophytica]PXY20335.1 hypothetical protein BAY59_31345 [Prauserella coralliicola]